MNKIQLYDLQNNPISDWLIEITDNRLLCNLDSIQFVPIGSIYKTNNFMVEDEESYLVYKNDLKNIHVNDKISHGCCGADGDILNVFDLQKNQIGYDYADCWMSHCVRIPIQNVVLKSEAIESYQIIFALVEYKNTLRIVDRIVCLQYNNVIKHRFEKQVTERLIWEIRDKNLRAELQSKVQYKRFDEIEFLLKNENEHEIWLHTKYEIIENP